MRTLITILLLVCFAVVAGAQSQSADADAPKITVVKKGWERTRFQLGWDRLEEIDPDTTKVNSQANRQTNRMRRGRTIVGYTYKATLHNDTAKMITKVVWQYSFTDSVKQETTRYQFLNEIKIPIGKEKTISRFIKHPPSRTVSAHSEMIEDVTLLYVEFEDGTRWQRQST